ncbi:MAG: hypothetical protein M0C28_25040 [Candidatus Moduliflexus flocculans]|nr:hypothetical protein [Candidatus Moduliflexus flocculans]
MSIKRFLILFKAHLFEVKNSIENSEEERLFAIIDKPDYIRDVDVALLTRLLAEIDYKGISAENTAIQNLLYDEYNSGELQKIVLEAKTKILEFAEQSAKSDVLSRVVELEIKFF